MLIKHKDLTDKHAFRLGIVREIDPEAFGAWKCPTCGAWGFLIRDSKIWKDDTTEAGLTVVAKQNHRWYSPACPDHDMTGKPCIVLPARTRKYLP